MASRSPRWRRHARQRCGGVEQFLDLVDAQHAGAPERGVVDGIGAGQRAGVRGRRRARPLRAPPAFDHDHRLDARGTRARPT